MISRRTFIGALAGGLLAAPLAVEAQPAGKPPVVGVLNSGIGPRSLSVDTMRQGLHDLGWVEGQSIAFEVLSLAKTISDSLGEGSVSSDGLRRGDRRGRNNR